MHDTPPHSTRRPAARFARRYGSTFNAFDHLANVSLCSQQLGKVEIDCRFRHSKTQWGILGSNENQAAILYVDLSFVQPKDCRLSSATVWISLEDAHQVATDSKSSQSKKRYLIPSSPSGTTESVVMREDVEEYEIVRFLQFTHDFGPRQLAGEATKATTKRTRHLTPQITIGGNGVGGLGFDQEQSVEQTSRWLFTGNLLQGSKLGDNADDMAYRTLKWELSEDNFQPQSTHNNTIQTAFTIEHDGNAFIICIEIKGKLERRHERMKSHVKQLLKFPKDPQNQGTSLTLVLPQSKEARRLDHIAKGIPFDMERLNLEGIWPQLPTAAPVSFQSTAEVSSDERATRPTATEGVSTGPSATERTSAARVSDSRPLQNIDSFPEEETTTIGRGSTKDIPVKTWNRTAESPTRERPTAIRDRNKQSPSLIPSEQDNERYGKIFRDSQVDGMASKPVRISPRMEPSEEKISDDDFNELALQLAKSPFLLRVILWLISILAFIPKKVPGKNAKLIG